MLFLRCPHCRERRDESEFRCGGEFRGPPPAADAALAAWTGYLFERDNTKGGQIESWHHLKGCGQWFLVRRDTVSQDITEVGP